LNALQKEFQNLKTQFAGESRKQVSDESQKNVSGNEEDAENIKVSDDTSAEKQTHIVSKKTEEQSVSEVGQQEAVAKNQADNNQESNESSKNTKLVTEITTPGKSLEGKGGDVKNTSGNQSPNSEIIPNDKEGQSDENRIQGKAGDTVKNIIADKSNNESTDATSENRVIEQAVTSASQQSESSQRNEQKIQGTPITVAEESSKNNLSQKAESGKAVEGNPKETQEQTSPKMDTEQRQRMGNTKRVPVDKGETSSNAAIPADAVKKPKQDTSVKSQLINSGAFTGSKQSESGQTTKTELAEQQKKVMGSFVNKNKMTNFSAKGLETKNPQAEKGQKEDKLKNKVENKQRGVGSESSEGRNKLLKRLGIAGMQTQKQAKPLNLQGFDSISVGNSSMNLKEQISNWEEQVTQTIETGNERESKPGPGTSSARLGQMPITNVSLRKKILPGLTQRIQQAASSAKKEAGSWQKHSFTLDDGKNIQLSVRESKGVLHVKMGSMNLDLGKLLQQNLQQIREHLRQEFGTEIDLQFENQQQGEQSELSDDAESSNRKRNYRNNLASESLAAENVEEVSAKTVRNFGYNQMEWTA